VIDSVKGVEEQTLRLMDVCRMRKYSGNEFSINKMDLQGKDPFDLLDELEQKLKIRLIRLHGQLDKGIHSGVYNIYRQNIRLLKEVKRKPMN